MRKEAIVAFALLALFAGNLFAVACKSYDQSCNVLGSPGDCCNGLECQQFTNASGTFQKCTQKSNVCTINPEAYVAPPPVLAGGQLAGGVADATLDLASGSGIVGSSSSIYKAGWFSDWNTAGAIGVAITIAIVALAAIAGRAFNLPEAKAFADAEMMQAVVSILLVASLIGLVGFFDIVARQAVNGGDLPVDCTSTSEPCYITAAKTYLQTLYDTADQSARNELAESVSNQKTASFGISMQMNFWWLLFAGGTYRPNAGMSIPAERAGAIFEIASKMMTSLVAQKYFIEVVSFGIAPIFLLLGIVLRGMFFTRKLGGLLLAIAVALFIIYPLTYAFAWYTLNVTVYGERTLGVDDPSCPAECTARYPVAFFVNSTNGELVKFETTQSMIRAGINDGNWATGGPGGAFPGLVACRDLSSIGITAGSALEASGFGTLAGDRLSDPIKNWASDKYANYRLVVNDSQGVLKDYLITGNDASTISVQGTLPELSSTSNPNYWIYGTPSAGCPDYCREVPFPANLPGCDIAKCSAVSAGCKIIRQRADCSDPGSDNYCADAGNACPMSCRTKLPTENKCYYKDGNPSNAVQANIVPANLAVNCGGCSVCPNWCRFAVKNASSGTYSLVYKDEAACSSCKNAFAAGTCPLQCVYATEVGKSISCDSLCNGCPKYCRVNNTEGTWFDTYDVDPPGLEGECMSAACQQCPSECKVVMDAPEPGCAAFPTVSPPTKCQNCPEYCRYTDYSYISPSSSISGGAVLSSMCKTGLGGRLDCRASACDNSCKASPGPPTCREYNAGDASTAYCRHCPAEVRVGLLYQSGGATLYSGPPLLSDPSSCQDANCGVSCKPTLDIPNETVNAACRDDVSTGCPYGCRLEGADAYLDASCTVPVSSFDCTATLSMTVSSPSSKSASSSISCNLPSAVPQPNFVKTETITATCFCLDLPPPEGLSGKARVLFSGSASELERAKVNFDCSNYQCTGNAGYDFSVDDASYSCSQSYTLTHTERAPFTYGETKNFACTPKKSWCGFLPSACKVDVGSPANKGYVCSEFLGNGAGNPIDETPIDDRSAPYDDRTNCKQCPENCRINGYEGDCGVKNNTNNQFVDCSSINCRQACRVEVAVGPTPGATCQPFDQFGQSCDSCPALCRRSADTLSGVADCPADKCGPYDPIQNIGCTETCQVGDPPARMCENCFNCELDCTYYPAVRTDCSTVCSDEALAGPVNIGPQDFIKKLPGAQGQLDVKNVGTLMVPALVMPLFCLVIVIAFIRVFSPVLGGDMEIPGLGRII